MVAAFALTLARVGTFINVLPLLGGSNIPHTVKVGLTLALTVMFVSADERLLQADRAGVDWSNWVGMSVALGREVLIGTMLGFAMGLFLLPAHVAAEFITQEAGLTFANIVSTTSDGSTSALTTIFEMLASVLFFALDLHHVFLLLLQQTLTHAPAGQLTQILSFDLVAAVSGAEEGGLLLAGPVALCLFITTVVLALMSRAAPQLNLYSVGFPLRVLVSLGALMLMMPQILAGMVGWFSVFLEMLQMRG
jgi:flagellar biosynthetic protein FliR